MAKTTSIFFTLIILLLCSCTKSDDNIRYIDREVRVEIPIMKELQFEKPKPYINYLLTIDENSSSKDVVEAYVNTVLEMQKYIDTVDLMIKPFIKE